MRYASAMVAHTKNIAKELREIRSTLEVLEAAYFNIIDKLEARHTPYLLNMSEAARLLGIGPQALRWLIRDKKIRSSKIGKRVMVSRSALENFAGRAVGFEISPGLADRKLRRRPQSIHELTSVEARALGRRQERAVDQRRLDIARANTTEPGRYGPNWVRDR